MRGSIFGNRDYVLDPSRTLCGLEVCPTDGTLNTPYYFEVKDFGGYVTIPWEKWIFKGEYLKRDFSEDIIIGTFTHVITKFIFIPGFSR